MKKLCRKVHQKLVPDPFLSLVNKPKHLLYAVSSFEIKYFAGGLSKGLNRVNFIFSFKPSRLNGQKYQKQTGPGTNDKLLFRLQNKFKIIPFF